jgi:hypothetical protein
MTYARDAGARFRLAAGDVACVDSPVLGTTPAGRPQVRQHPYGRA